MAQDAGEKAFEILARLEDGDFVKQWSARRQMLLAARSFYTGEHPAALKVRDGDKDPNVVINFCRKVIDNSVAWLFGDRERGQMIKMMVKAALDAAQTDTATPDEAQAYLDEVWEKNGGAWMLQKLGRRVSTAGHGFLKIVPPTDPANSLGVPQIVSLKPEAVMAVPRADNTDEAEAFVIEWEEKRPSASSGEGRLRTVRVRQMFIMLMGEAGHQWVIVQAAETGRGRQKWVLEGKPQVWPYMWCPVVDWQNLPSDDYYGASDLEDLTGLNVAMNFTASNVNRILYIHGHPRTVGIGFDAGEVQDTAIDSFWTIGSKEAKVQNLEMQSDLGSAFKFMQFLTQALFTIGRDMDVGSLQDKIGQVTNFGLRVLAGDALEKLGEKRLSYGMALTRVNAALLELGGYAERETVIQWRNPLPTDDTSDVQRLQVERDMGIVSKATAAGERGRDWEEEQQLMAEEKVAEGNVGAELLRAFETGQVSD